MTHYLNVEVPEWALPAIGENGEPFCASRYIAIHGGRAGGKSHFIAERIVLRAFHPNKLGKDGKVSPVRIVCIREVQNSLKESVKQLIADKIHKLGLSHAFEILDAEIRGPNDSLIIFKGMQAHNASNIKSLEGFDIAWVEEAQTLSEVSLRMLRPTIRKSYADGTSSQLIFTWNPRFETDPVDQFFRGNSPEAKGWAKPRNATIVECNWHDNPWLDDTIYNEKDGDYESDPEMAEHVWGGGYERVTAGAYYANLIANLERTGRIGGYPYDPSLGPVYTSWDLGVDDYTAIWFFQIYEVDGIPRVRVIDYFEFTGFGAQDIVRSAMPEYTPDLQDRVVAMAEIGRDEKYVYQRHFFPHDLGQREWGNAGLERITVINKLGVPMHQLHRGVATNPANRIEATRNVLPMCEFNSVSRVMIGLSRLRRYQKKFNVNLGIYLGPEHDSNSHASDAFGEFAINCGLKMPEPKADNTDSKPHHQQVALRFPTNRGRKSGTLRV